MHSVLLPSVQYAAVWHLRSHLPRDWLRSVPQIKHKPFGDFAYFVRGTLFDGKLLLDDFLLHRLARLRLTWPEHVVGQVETGQHQSKTTKSGAACYFFVCNTCMQWRSSSNRFQDRQMS
jgi:hypothetical protein